MASRSRFATSFLSLLLVSPLLYAQLSQTVSPMGAEIAALQGKVLNADGRPVSGIHVELDDAATAVPVTSTYTQQDGSFELNNIPKGNYEVIADSKDSQVCDEVSVQPGQSSLQLRLPSGNTAPPDSDATISVAHILVPRTAQRMYDSAYIAFQKGKFNVADKQLRAALQIDPEYADAMTLRGLIKLSEPDIGEAQQLLEQAVHADPGETAAYIGLAALYNHQGRFDDAIRVSQKSLSLAPRTWQAYLEIAKASLAKNMYRAALKFARQAERLGGNTDAEVHLVKAYALVPLKLYKDAKYELMASLSREHRGNVADLAHNMLARVDAMQTLGTDAKP